MQKRGVTLVEVMITVLIFAFIVAAIYAVFSSGKNARDSADSQADLTRNARTAMQDVLKTLSESNAGSISETLGVLPTFTDPLNGQQHQILIFASARGNPADASEDGTHRDNNYVHLGSDYRPLWRSAVIYCTYVENGTQQLRKYTDYGASTTYYESGKFPIFFSSVSANTFILQRADASVLTLARNSGRVIANYIVSEDSDNSGTLDANEDDGNASLPPDNADGVLDLGADFTLTGRMLKVKLLLARSETALTQGVRFHTVTLDGLTEVRNE